MPILDDEAGSVPDNVIPFPAMRANAKLTEAFSAALAEQNSKLSESDKFPGPLDCLTEIIRRRGLPRFCWPAAWPQLGERCRAYTGDVVIVTGPTGAGKTSFAIQVGLSFTGNGIPVLWCALELDPTQITERIVANMHGVHTMAIKEHWTEARIAHTLQAVHDMWKFVPRLMDPDKQYAALRRAIAVVWKTYRVKPLIVIDYLGKLASLARDIRMATIAAAENIRALAVEEECFVLMLAQPSRSKNQALTGKVDHESATDTSGSAGESGEVENAAAIEINLEVFKADDKDELEARWNIAKSRHVGREGKVGARFKKPGGVWDELDYVPVHPLAVKAEHEKAKKDKHRAGPAPSIAEVTADMNLARAGDADASRRAEIMTALARHGMLGMEWSEIRGLRGVGRGNAAQSALQELARSGAIEKAPSGRWRVVARIE